MIPRDAGTRYYIRAMYPECKVGVKDKTLNLHWNSDYEGQNTLLV